ncbi:MAG: hypothetical protein ABIE55_03475 [Candidatus Aenigmatarchaeota archaeon]
MKKALKIRNLRWFFIGFGTAFVLLSFLVSFYTLKVIVPSQINSAASFAETACYSNTCYEMSNITADEYYEIQKFCRDKTEEALVLAIKPEGEVFLTLVTRNFNWILITGISFLIAGFIVFRMEKRPV